MSDHIKAGEADGHVVVTDDDYELFDYVVDFLTPAWRSFAVADRPAIRTLVSAAIGALYASILGLSMIWASVCVLTFAALGWLGMRWLRYLDF